MGVSTTTPTTRFTAMAPQPIKNRAGLRPQRPLRPSESCATRLSRGRRRREQQRTHPMAFASPVDEAIVNAPCGEQLGPLDVVDEARMLRDASFPIPADELIQLTKGLLAANNGADDPSLLAEDFQFVAPVVGPLGREEFASAFKSFKLKEAFSEWKTNAHHFRVDPFEPNRVWFTTRMTAVNTGPMMGDPTGIRVISPPQASSCRYDWSSMKHATKKSPSNAIQSNTIQCIRFNTSGKCDDLTVGYVMDRRQGNTGGLGAVFGILNAIGRPLPFPEARPYKRSWRFSLFVLVSRLAKWIRPKGKTVEAVKEA
mmetsp:Transcript_8112/g.20837  ORF Transcript_8112/g.20837 Transcript_8112/m.20837 type:complete len:313 (-) Transcript_8112:1194-2132(-)